MWRIAAFILALCLLCFGLVSAVGAFPPTPDGLMAPVGQVDMGISQDVPIPEQPLPPQQEVILNFRVENFSAYPARNVAAVVSLPQGAQYQYTLLSGFWKQCTIFDAQTNAPRLVCTKDYFLAHTATYMSVKIRSPQADWPYPLVVWAAVGNDVNDYNLLNNYFSYTMLIEGRPQGGANLWKRTSLIPLQGSLPP